MINIRILVKHGPKRRIILGKNKQTRDTVGSGKENESRIKFECVVLSMFALRGFSSSKYCA